MTPATFRTIGEALRGPHWQRAIAADIGTNERTVRRNASGECPIPDERGKTLLVLLYTQAAKLQTLARTIRMPV